MSASDRRSIGAWRMAALPLAAATLCLCGCAVATVGGAVVGSAVSVVSTGVKVGGKVVEKTVDVVTPGSK